MTVSGQSTASCSFEDCSSSMIARVVTALVDQLCADADIDIALLDALDYPLGETLSALHRFGVAGATVTVSLDELYVEIELSNAVSDAVEFLGTVDAVVGSFFDVMTADEAARVTLVGNLG